MAEKDYIERGAFRKKLIDRQITDAFFDNVRRDEIGHIVDMLDNSPAADVVEVVRCKDCKHRHSSEFCECRPEDAYCSDGERKEVTP